MCAMIAIYFSAMMQFLVSNSRGLFFPVEDVANNRAEKSEEWIQNALKMFKKSSRKKSFFKSIYKLY